MRLDIYDTEMMPSGMKAYLRSWGWHFSPKMAEWAISRMQKKDPAGNMVKIQPYTKEQMEALLSQHGIEVKKDIGYDALYCLNMAKADYYGSSIPGESYLAKFVKDYTSDPDAPEGKTFCRFYADTICAGVPIVWEDMI